ECGLSAQFANDGDSVRGARRRKTCRSKSVSRWAQRKFCLYRTDSAFLAVFCNQRRASARIWKPHFVPRPTSDFTFGYKNVKFFAVIVSIRRFKESHANAPGYGGRSNIPRLDDGKDAVEMQLPESILHHSSCGFACVTFAPGAAVQVPTY